MPTSRSFMCCLGLAGTLIGLTPAAAAAQDVATTFDELRTRLKTGDTITVTDGSGQEVTGRLVDVSATSLALQVRRQQLTFSPDTLGEVRQRRRDPLRNGVGLGLLGGAIFGGVLAASLSSEGEVGGLVIGALGLYAGMGAGIGALVDALIVRDTTIYSSSSSRRPATIVIAPILSPERLGVQVSTGF
jgi:hypothetical protein